MLYTGNMSTATATKPATYKSNILGTVELHDYVDAYAGQAPTDRVPVNCGRCGGRGRIEAFSFIDGGRCWGCFGSGMDSISVATARKNARSDAFLAEYGDQIDAYWAVENARIEAAAKAAEFAEAWDAAHAEAVRRAAMNTNTLGAVGERLKNIEATVTVSTGFERDAYRGYGTEFVKIVVMTTGDGTVLKVSGVANCLYGLERGDRVKVTGTVKEHSSYRGQIQTVLQRPVIKRLDEDGVGAE